MSQKDDLLYLGHMLDAARWIMQRLNGVARHEFDADEDLQLALTHQLQIIGEAARRVSDGGRQGLPGVPWREVTGMRHRIVHDYININLGIVWETATQHVPPLVSELLTVIPLDPPE
jgi:uncharacterized protein with HEPN domain